MKFLKQMDGNPDFILFNMINKNGQSKRLKIYKKEQ